MDQHKQHRVPPAGAHCPSLRDLSSVVTLQCDGKSSSDSRREASRCASFSQFADSLAPAIHSKGSRRQASLCKQIIPHISDRSKRDLQALSTIHYLVALLNTCRDINRSVCICSPSSDSPRTQHFSDQARSRKGYKSWQLRLNNKYTAKDDIGQATAA